MEIVEIAGGFRVPKDERIGAWQIETQRLDHDEFTVPLACKYIAEGATVIDCGAFNGDHSIAYSEAVGKDGLVIAVEAGLDAFECLFHNVQYFHSKVRILRRCLSDKSAQLIGYVPDSSNLGASRCIENDEGGSVFSITIDDIVQAGMDWGEKPPSFIKIDCEGWEVKILKGAKQTIEKYRPVLLVEVNPSALKLQDGDPIDIMRIMKHHGYSLEIIQPQCTWNSEQFDVLCLPKDYEQKQAPSPN